MHNTNCSTTKGSCKRTPARQLLDKIACDQKDLEALQPVPYSIQSGLRLSWKFFMWTVLMVFGFGAATASRRISRLLCRPRRRKLRFKRLCKMPSRSSGPARSFPQEYCLQVATRASGFGLGRRCANPCCSIRSHSTRHPRPDCPCDLEDV
jgi:hypothetical protein